MGFKCIYIYWQLVRVKHSRAWHGMLKFASVNGLSIQANRLAGPASSTAWWIYEKNLAVSFAVVHKYHCFSYGQSKVKVQPSTAGDELSVEQQIVYDINHFKTARMSHGRMLLKQNNKHSYFLSNVNVQLKWSAPYHAVLNQAGINSHGKNKRAMPLGINHIAVTAIILYCNITG